MPRSSGENRALSLTRSPNTAAVFRISPPYGSDPPRAISRGCHPWLFMAATAHVSAYRRDDGRFTEPIPIDALKTEGVIGVPKEHRLIAQPPLPQQPIQMENRVHRVPFLGHHEERLVLNQRAAENAAEHVRRQRRRVVDALSFLAVVNAHRMISTDPPAPAMEMESGAVFVTGEMRVADEPEVGFEAGVN